MAHLQVVTRMILAGLVVLCLILVAPSSAESQESLPQPPDDAPADSFSEGTAGPLLEPPPDYRPVEPVPAAPPNIGGGIWLAQGPGPSINGQVEAITPGPNEVSGAIHTVAAHPTDPDILFAGGANGGIWRTTNATAASPMWTPLTDFETSLSIGALEFDPTDPTHQTLVAGIGLYSSFGSYGGQRPGLLKTVDGGATWTPIGGAPSLPINVNVSGVAPRGMKITASSNYATPFTCNLLGLWHSSDGGANFWHVGGPVGVAFDLASDAANPSVLYTGLTYVPSCSPLFNNGIYKSVNDGLNWTKISTAAVDAFIIDGTTNNIEIAANGQDVFLDIVQSGRTAAVFHSADGGATWTIMDLPRTPEGAPQAIALPDVLIPGSPVTIDHTPSGSAHGLSSGMEVNVSGVLGTASANGVWTVSVLDAFRFELFGSSDFGPWTPGTGAWNKVVGMNPKVKPGSQGGVHASIRIDPATATTVYIGGDRQDYPFPTFLGALDYSGRLFRGDATVLPTGAIPSPQWEHLTHLIGPPTPGGGTLSTSAPHADSREMVFDAADDLIEVDDGGIYRRTSPATSAGDWFSINGNIQVTEQHDVAYDSLSNRITSGNQDTGTTRQQSANGLTWDSVTTADGGDVAVDDSDPLFSVLYSSFQNLGNFKRRTYDATGALTHTISVGLNPLGALSFFPVFVTPVVLNKVNPLYLVLGGCNAIFESFDNGDSILEVPGLVSPTCSPSVTYFSQNAIAYGGFLGAVPNPDVLYVGSAAALYNRTAPGALAPVPTYPGTERVRDVVLNPANWHEVFVIESNYSRSFAPAPPFFSKVWWTTDSGVSWTDITGNLTDPGLQTVEFVPGAPNRLLVGGRDGVFSLNLPAVPPGPYVWGELGTGLPNAPVWDMEYDTADNVLVVGTMGRGAWTLQENGACGKPDNLLVNNQWVSGVQIDEACMQITGGPSLDVTATGDLIFRSPTVALDNGFAVKTSGKFEVENVVP